MADLCPSILVVLGVAWVVRRVMDGPTPQPLTAVRRRGWVFLSLLASVAVHGVLAGLDLIAWRAVAIPAALLGLWLVLCRMMVRPGPDASGAVLFPRLSPATLALTVAAVVACWIAVNPMGDRPNRAVADTTAARAAARTSSASQTAQVGPFSPVTNPSNDGSTSPTRVAAVPGYSPAEVAATAATVATATAGVPRTAGATGSTGGTAPPVVASNGQVTIRPRTPATATAPSTGGTQREAGSGVVMASRGAIIYVGDNGHLTANTGPTASSGAVALGVKGSDLRAGNSGDVGSAAGSAATAAGAGERRAGTASSRRSTGPENGTLALLGKHGKGHRGTSLSGFEDHSVSVDGDGQIVTYDDSNVFINRKGRINANTGDTDSSGLNAVDVGRSTVRAGNSGDGEGGVDGDTEEEDSNSPFTSSDERAVPGSRVAERTGAGASARRAGAGGASGGRRGAFGTVTDEGASSATGKNAFVVGADGVDDVSIRSHGRNDIVSYDDSNVTVGGEGKVNAQIGDSDTGGGVVMGIHDSDVRAGCEGDLCYSANPGITLAAQLLGSSGVRLTQAQWRQLDEFITRQYGERHPSHRHAARARSRER